MRILVTCVALAACADPNPPVVSIAREPILGGVPAAAGQFPTVVWLFESIKGALCTGTLISPTVVLTAAHCIDPVENGRTEAQILGEELVGFDHLQFNPTDGAGVQAIFEDPMHPDFSDNNTLGKGDLALVVLKTPKLDRLTTPLDLSAGSMIGKMTTQVGFGIHSAGTGDSGDLYVVNGRVVEACGTHAVAGSDDSLICFDQTDAKGQCNGDSGGPALDAQGHIIGVVSYGDQNCTSFGADSRPSFSRAFIVAHVPELADNNCAANGVCNLSCGTDPDCTASAPPVCGNGKLEGAEQCDDGAKNGTAGDTCSGQCKSVSGQNCGDGLVEGNEECDDGTKNGTDGDPCSAICKMAELSSDGGGCSSSGTRGGFGALIFALCCLGATMWRTKHSRRRR